MEDGHKIFLFLFFNLSLVLVAVVVLPVVALPSSGFVYILDECAFTYVQCFEFLLHAGISESLNFDEDSSDGEEADSGSTRPGSSSSKKSLTVSFVKNK